MLYPSALDTFAHFCICFFLAISAVRVNSATCVVSLIVNGFRHGSRFLYLSQRKRSQDSISCACTSMVNGTRRGEVGVSTNLKWTGKKHEYFDGQGKVGVRKNKVTGVVKSEDGYVRGHNEVEKYYKSYKTTMYFMIALHVVYFTSSFVLQESNWCFFKLYNHNCLWQKIERSGELSPKMCNHMQFGPVSDSCSPASCFLRVDLVLVRASKLGVVCVFLFDVFFPSAMGWKRSSFCRNLFGIVSN